MGETYCAASIVTWERGIEGDNTVLIGLLKTTKESLVDVRCIVQVTVTACYDAAVHAGAVAVPDLEESFWYGFARVHIDELDVECQGHTLLPIGDILADKLALDPVRSLGGLGTEHTAVVAREEGVRRRVGSDAGKIAVVVDVDHVVEVPGFEEGLGY